MARTTAPWRQRTPGQARVGESVRSPSKGQQVAQRPLDAGLVGQRRLLEDGREADGDVERSNATNGSYGDAEFRCLPLAANGVEPVACIWREDASVGMTLDLTPESDAGGALKAAYDATHT